MAISSRYENVCLATEAEWRNLMYGEFIVGEKEMGDGDDYSGRPLPGTAGDPGTDKTVKNAWQIDIGKWFRLRKPTAKQGEDCDVIRQNYGNLAEVVMDFCPANPDRTHAIRQLKESMQTAISSIVCSDTWDDIPGPKGE